MRVPGLDNLPHFRKKNSKNWTRRKEKKELKSELKIETAEVLTNENK